MVIRSVFTLADWKMVSITMELELVYKRSAQDMVLAVVVVDLMVRTI